MPLLSKRLFSQNTKHWVFALIHGTVSVSTHCTRRLHHQLEISSFITLLQFNSSTPTVLVFKIYFSFKTIFNSMNELTKRGWFLQFSSYFPSADLQYSKADCNFKNKNGNQISAKHRVILFFFPKWLPTARTLPRF